MINLNNEINSIPSKNVRTVVESAIAKVSPQFFKAPASSTGKYHPAYAVTEGGLAKHTKAVVFFVQNLLEAYSIEDDYSKSLCIGAGILHDTCKSGVNWEYAFTRHEHPLLVKELLTEDELAALPDGEKIWEDMNEIISSHMGKWNTAKNSSVVLPLPETPLQKLLHAADYLASRKQVSTIEGITDEGTPVSTIRPVIFASMKQKLLIGALMGKAGRLKKDVSKYSFVDTEALTAGQASIVIRELKELTGEVETA